jgi:hypothetical protein
VHHFDTTAGQSESERPDGSVAGPSYELVDGGSVQDFCVSPQVWRLGFRPGETAYTAYSATPIGLKLEETAVVDESTPRVGGLSECLFRCAT